MRIGVGKPPSKYEGADHVLSKFTPDERELVDAASDRALEAIRVLVRDGVDAAQNLLARRADAASTNREQDNHLRGPVLEPGPYGRYG